MNLLNLDNYSTYSIITAMVLLVIWISVEVWAHRQLPTVSSS